MDYVLNIHDKDNLYLYWQAFNIYLPRDLCKHIIDIIVNYSRIRYFIFQVLEKADNDGVCATGFPVALLLAGRVPSNINGICCSLPYIFSRYNISGYKPIIEKETEDRVHLTYRISDTVIRFHFFGLSERIIEYPMMTKVLIYDKIPSRCNIIRKEKGRRGSYEKTSIYRLSF